MAFIIIIIAHGYNYNLLLLVYLMSIFPSHIASSSAAGKFDTEYGQFGHSL